MLSSKNTLPFLTAYRVTFCLLFFPPHLKVSEEIALLHQATPTARDVLHQPSSYLSLSLGQFYINLPSSETKQNHHQQKTKPKENIII